jgi:hypothetical protein
MLSYLHDLDLPTDDNLVRSRQAEIHCFKNVNILTSLAISSEHKDGYASVQLKADVQSFSLDEFMHTNNGTVANWPI